MISNHLYNLMMQLTVEAKSLKRIQENYRDDHEGCEACADFWDKLEEDKKEHIKDLEQLIKTHLSE